MIANRGLKTPLSGALVLALLAGAAWTASAPTGTSASPAPAWEQNQQGPNGGGDPDLARTRSRDQVREQTPDQLRDRIRERIRSAQQLSAGERQQMQENLEACARAGVTDPALGTVFPGGGGARALGVQTMLQLQARIRAMAQDGLPVEPALAKVREAMMKGVPEPRLGQVGERVEQHTREAERVLERARADGLGPAPDVRRERQMVREMAQQMWRGTTGEDMDALRTRARDRLRTRDCSLEDLVAAAETATRLREEGVEARRAMRVAGEALSRGYGADEMRRLHYMMVYRHREGRGVDDLVDDFEHCLGLGMDSAHMYQYMMQHGWMGPGDMQGPGGSRPIDDQGHGKGSPGSGPGGGGSGSGGTGGGGTPGGGSGGTGPEGGSGSGGGKGGR